ncbi:MAG: Gp138 family membrane-puncturing spike protein [Candidatus Saccharimonadales bacterium]
MGTSEGDLYVNDLVAGEEETLRALRDAIMADLRVAMPGIVQSFNQVEMTVTVQPAVKERVLQGRKRTWMALPLLQDVPVVLPRAGGFMLSLPIQPGDECILLFQDLAEDSWWQNGGADNTQPIKRRHSLSDAVAIMGVWSKPNVPANYSTTAAQLRTADGTQFVEVGPSGIRLVGSSITANGTPIG